MLPLMSSLSATCSIFPTNESASLSPIYPVSAIAQKWLGTEHYVLRIRGTVSILLFMTCTSTVWAPYSYHLFQARASSDLMQQLTAAASSLARFQQAAALNPTDLSAPSTSRAPSSSPTPLPPASTLFHLSPLPGISPPHLRQAQSYSPPSIGSTPPKFPTLPLPRPQHFSPLHQHSPLNARQGPGDYQPCTPPVNQAALPTGRRYTDPPPPAHFHPSQHQSPRQSHHDRAPPLQSRTHVTPPPFIYSQTDPIPMGRAEGS